MLLWRPGRDATQGYGFLITILIPLPGDAQTTPRMPLSDVIAAALAKNPEIIAAQNRYDAARQRPAQERSLPDPMVSAGYNANGNPLPGAGLGTEPTANIGFTVSQEVPYPGKRDLRGSIAAREADAEFQQIEAARLNVTARVKQAYYRLAYAHAVTDVLTRNRELLETLLKVSEGRYAVGQAAQQDVIKAQTQLSILELQLERVRREGATREGELNALMNRPVTTPIGQPDELQLTAFDSSLDGLIATANEHAPMLRRDQIMIERSQFALDAARREYKPDFAVTGGYFYMGAMRPMYEVRFDVRVPLQRARRAAALAEQLSTVDAVRNAYESSRLNLQERLQEEFQMASLSVRLARVYRETVLPQARLALESSMASYQTGAVDFLSVLTNFGTVLDYEMTYFDELRSYHTAVSRLEELTGTSIVH
ncbi:MAG: TolC family protein [Acidobacteria bacterium]|nr:TolC family protein [Acidobacteriota bacterium]